MVVLVIMLSTAAEVMEARPVRAADGDLHCLVLAGLFADGEGECGEAKAFDGEEWRFWGFMYACV